MIPAYMAVCVQPEVAICRKRERIAENLKRHLQIIDFIHNFTNLELPIKLIVFPEFFLQGWAQFYITHSGYVRDIAISIPGEETGRLGEKAKEYNCYICGAALALDPEWPDRYFNTAFIVGPSGEVIHKYYKLGAIVNMIEHSISPHDMYDAFVKKYGDSLDAFFPVTDTEIGKLGTFICYDGAYPEIPRGLAANGAEVLLRPTAWLEPWQSMPSTRDGWWNLQNRARAMDNVCYLVAPNWGGTGGERPLLRSFTPGGSMIVDYRGRVLASADYVGETFIYAEIDIELLRQFRAKARWGNFIPTMRAEVFSKIYERSYWPKNRFLQKPPETVNEIWPVADEAIQQCLKEGIFTPPATQA